MEKEKIKQIIAKYYGSVPTNNLRIESLRLAKDIVCSQFTMSADYLRMVMALDEMPESLKDMDDKMLDRILYIAFRIEEYITN